VDFIWRRTAKPASLDGDIRTVFEQHGTECQVGLSGSITIDSSPDLRMVLLQTLQSDQCQTLIVDLNDVEYVDTAGLAILVEILKVARTHGKTFHLVRISQRPRYLLEATRLLHLFEEVNKGEPPVSEPSPSERSQ
jgi:anti-sigma B factor antagonist